MLLVTGPTGSGKTTTLYSLINGRRSGEVNIITVEDPVEYRLPGISQIQVNERTGLNFASALRSVLRQDPDIILVGEVRDRETADIAFQAALTGHLVFSTLHTNDAVATVNRLLDMKVDRFKIAPALIGVVSQRLARRVCPECREEEAPAEGMARLLAAAGLPTRQWRGKGCAGCGFTGLSGRAAVVELLDLSHRDARDVLGVEMDAGAFRALALKKGWLLPAAYDALWHLAAGTIPVEEAAAFLDAPDLPAP
ncbi:MAG: type IV pilus assembly protein PilB, partial [Elusimicrobia bacterium]